MRMNQNRCETACSKTERKSNQNWMLQTHMHFQLQRNPYWREIGGESEHRQASTMRGPRWERGLFCTSLFALHKYCPLHCSVTVQIPLCFLSVNTVPFIYFFCPCKYSSFHLFSLEIKFASTLSMFLSQQVYVSSPYISFSIHHDWALQI